MTKTIPNNKDAVYDLTVTVEHAQRLKLHTINLTTEHAADLLKRIAELEADSARLRWLIEASGMDDYGDYDVCDFIECILIERGHDEPDAEDEFDGWRRLIDAAIKQGEN